MTETNSRRRPTLNSAGVFSRSLLLAALLTLVAGAARGDVCVWRDPERTMQRIFPAARDYKTITTKMTPDRIAAIEKAIGMPLDHSEKREFDRYEITGDGGGQLGTILALAGRGEYGAIEVVIGVNPAGRIVGVYIQRTRERVSRALQAPEFLKQFAGKTKNDGLDSIKPASPDAEAASRVVAFVIKKMLVFHDVLKQ